MPPPRPPAPPGPPGPGPEPVPGPGLIRHLPLSPGRRRNQAQLLRPRRCRHPLRFHSRRRSSQPEHERTEDPSGCDSAEWLRATGYDARAMNPVKGMLLWASQNPSLREQLPRMRFVKRSVSRFMPGESAEDAIEAAQRMARDLGIPATFTRLGENTSDLSEAAEASGDYLRLLDRIEELGLDAEISIKLTQLGIDQDPAVTATHIERLVDRSAELGRTCWIDMEASAYVDRTLDLYERSSDARRTSASVCRPTCGAPTTTSNDCCPRRRPSGS